ncbi:MAG TPA: hypothetical protein VK753_00895, partial [Xanthomonadaceae bacterium]|nr:hypothetical protein [Xanthomonadaceae bacterium]
MTEVSTLRLYVMRCTYLMISVFLATQIWPGIVHHPQLDLMRGVARSLLAAMLPFVLLGLRYPLQMLPVMLFELCWKSIWLIAFAYPLWTAHQIDADTWKTVKACLFGWVVFPIAIPWS